MHDLRPLPMRSLLLLAVVLLSTSAAPARGGDDRPSDPGPGASPRTPSERPLPGLDPGRSADEPLGAAWTACPDVGEGWLRDYDEAVLVAREQQKDLLVHFTGSDWCNWCIRLDEEVFRAKGWRARAAEDLVLCSLDFPRGEEAQARVPHPERNAELARAYGVTGYPTVLLMTPDGEVLGRTGYRRGGPDAYLSHLEGLRTDGHRELAEVDALLQRLEAANAEARPKVFGEVRSRLLRGGPNAPGGRRLERGVARAFEWDPDGALGLARPALTCFLELGRVDLPTLRAARTLDADNADGLFERALRVHIDQVRDREGVLEVLPIVDAWDATGEVHSKEDAFYICLLGAWWNEKQARDGDRAEHYARRGLDLGVGERQQRKALGDILGTGR